MSDSPRIEWQLPEPGSLRAARAIAINHGIAHPLVAQILARRGLISAELVDFLNPSLTRLLDPTGLRNLESARLVLDEAIRAGRPITIYGDYDVDGTTGAALLESYLAHRGAKVSSFIPFRHEGYGLTRASLEKIADQRAPQLLLTVDCGTSSRAEADYARSRGMEVVVTDHHRPTPGKQTNGIVVNPHVPGDGYLNKNLAGVSVAYKLVAALHGSQPIAFLDLVAMGTIADVMSLEGENRILVREGLARLAHTRRPGVAALLATAIDAVPCEHGSGLERCFPVSAEKVAFQIGPRINAVGRMGLDPNLVVELFNTRDEARGREIAAQLNEANVARKEVTNKITDEAIAAFDGESPVIVMQLDIFKGIAGLVAGRLAAEWGRPAIVVDLDGSGSARSVDGVDLLTVLQTEYPQLVTAAGHSMAMGINGLRDPDALRKALDRHPWPPRAVGRVIEVDAICRLADLDMGLIRGLEQLEPTGQGNPAALLAVSGVKLDKVTRRGASGRDAKLRLRDTDGTTRGAIWFGRADRVPPEGTLVDVAGRPAYSKYSGSVELQVTDLRPTTGELELTLSEAA